MRRTFLVIGVVALVGGLVACGGDSKGEAKPTPTYTRAQYVDELMKDASQQLPVTTAQARCFVNASVDAFGLEAIREQGYTPKSFRRVPDVKALSKRIGGQPALDRLRAIVLDERCFAIADLLEGDLRNALPASVGDTQSRCFAERISADPAVRSTVGDLLAGGDYSEERFGGQIDAAVPGAAAACGISLDTTDS